MHFDHQFVRQNNGGSMKSIYQIVLVSSLFSFGSANAEPITLSKAAELACHRIERLVTLKKIDEAYLTKFQTLEVVQLQPVQATDPFFKATVSQYPGSNSSRNQVELFMDNQGKTLSQNIKSGDAAINSPTWPDKDAVTLTENSLHYVLEGWQGSNPLVEPFYSSMTQLVLSQVTDEKGQLVARSEIRSSKTSDLLEVYINVDGTFNSARIVQH